MVITWYYFYLLVINGGAYVPIYMFDTNEHHFIAFDTNHVG